MRIERLFADVPVREEPGTRVRRRFEDSGALAASATVARAQERAFAGLEVAESRRTAALVQQGAAIERAGAVLIDQGGRFARMGAAIEQREADQRRTVEFHGRVAQYNLDTDSALQKAASEASPDGRDLAERFDQERNAARERLFAGVEDPTLRAALTVKATDRDVISTLDARKVASGKLKQWSIDQFDTAEAARLKRVTEGRLDQATLEQTTAEHGAHVQDMMNSGVLTAAQGEASRKRFRTAVGRRVAAAEMATDPAGFLRRLQGGHYNAVLDQDQVDVLTDRAFNRVETLANAAARRQEQAERRADRGLRLQGEAAAKDGFELLDRGEDIAGWLTANKDRLGKADYAALIKANRREERVASDPDTLIDLQTRLDREDVTADASRAYRGGLLSKEDYVSIVGKTRAALKDDQPTSPYRSGRDLLRSTLDPTNLITGPGAQIAKAGMANALVEFDDWAAQNPTASRADAMGKAREAIQRYQIVTFERMSLSAELPRLYKGTRAAISPGALDQAERDAIQRFDAGRLPQADYMAELERIRNWRSILELKPQSGGAPAQGQQPRSGTTTPNPAKPR